jgi:hypothetical protein
MSPMARRFPEVIPEPTRSLQHSLSPCSSSTDITFVAPIFLVRDSDVIDIELGFFAHEASEQIRDRQLRTQKRYRMVIVTLTMLGVLAWVVSMAILVDA